MSGIPLWPKGVAVRVCRRCALVAASPYCPECGQPTSETKVYNKEGLAFEPEEGTRRDVRHGLTETDAEIMDLLTEGMTNSDIAIRLTITEQSVKWHLARIYPRIDVKNRVQAVAWWRRVRGEE